MWFTRYFIGDEQGGPVSDGVHQAFIGTDGAKVLLDLIESHTKDLVKAFVTDVGNWDMKITYVDGTTERIHETFFSSDNDDVPKAIHDLLPFKGVVSLGYYDN